MSLQSRNVPVEEVQRVQKSLWRQSSAVKDAIRDAAGRVLEHVRSRETFLLEHMARSRAGPQQAHRVLIEPDRDRPPRVVDEEGRFRQLRQPQAGSGRSGRNNPLPSKGRSKDHVRNQSSKRARKRNRKGNSAEQRASGSSSANT